MSKELSDARRKAQGKLDVKEISASLLGGMPVSRERLNDIVTVLQADPFFTGLNLSEPSRVDKLRLGLEISRKLITLARIHGWSEIEVGAIQSGVLGVYLPDTLHLSAFLSVIRTLGSDEQYAKWGELSRNGTVFGCYAQTELGHGSNVRRLEITSFYDPKTREFTINSPTFTARKWWIGGLGILANHAVVQAILQIPSVEPGNPPDNLGPHIFIVPIRDLQTHQPLPGVTVGDIGPKSFDMFAYIDNGYVSFDNVKIPYDNMLCRFTSLDPISMDYHITGNPKIAYASMVTIRAAYPITLGVPLAKAATIASRYLSIRRQFTKSGDDGGEEIPVIQYASTNQRLMPIIAQSYAFLFAFQSVRSIYETMLSNLLEKNDDSLLSEVHVITSSLKGVLSKIAGRGLESAELLLGGHGHSYFSGIGKLYASALPAQTFEGDNFVIGQQTAKALVKQFASVRKGNGTSALFESSAFLASPLEPLSKSRSVDTLMDWLKPEVQIAVLEHRALRLVSELDAEIVDGSFKLRDHSMHENRISRAFGDLYLVKQFYNILQQHSSKIKTSSEILHKLANLFGLDIILEALGDVVEDGTITYKQATLLRQAFARLSEELSAYAVALTDGFGFSDFELGSALGLYNGNPYQALFEKAQNEAVNHTDYTPEVNSLKRAYGLKIFETKSKI